MDIPFVLTELIQSNLVILHNDSAYHLNPNVRLAIYKTFGPSNQFINGKAQVILAKQGSIQEVVLSKADKTLGWLAILNAQKVMHLWEEAFPSKDIDLELNDGPKQMLLTGKDVLQGMTDIITAYDDLCDKFYWAINNLQFFVNEQVQYAVSSAYSALQVIVYGLEERNFVNSIKRSDEDTTPSDRDFAALAMKAYSAVDENPIKGKYYKDTSKIVKFDKLKRLEYWEWWLTEAIPQAWELAQNSAFPS